MQQTTVHYEEGTGGAIHPVKVKGSWRSVAGGIEFEYELDERRIPAREATMWIPTHRVVRIVTREI